jgi:hypothetical protein
MTSRAFPNKAGRTFSNTASCYAPFFLKGRDLPPRNWSSFWGAGHPLGAQIIAVADAYDNHISDWRTFSETTPEKALSVMGRYTPSKFDPVVMHALRESVLSKEGAPIQENELEIHTQDLRPGMMLAADLRSHTETLLLARGTVIENNNLRKLVKYHRLNPIPDTIAIYRKSPS